MTAPISSPSQQVAQAVERLRQLTQVSVQTSWQYWDADCKDMSAGSRVAGGAGGAEGEEVHRELREMVYKDSLAANSSPASSASPASPASPYQPLAIAPTDFFNWPVRELNAKGHIAWPAGRQVLWLAQKFVIPHDLQGYPLTGLALRLALTWWAEDAIIYVNGKIVQEGDLFDSSARVLLTSSAAPGDKIAVALRLVSPSHDYGALVRSLLLYEVAHVPGFYEQMGSCGGDLPSETGFLDPSFVADELAVSQILANQPEQLDTLAATVAEIDWTALPDKGKFDLSLSTLRQNLLKSKIQNLTSPNPPLVRGGRQEIGGEQKSQIQPPQPPLGKGGEQKSQIQPPLGKGGEQKFKIHLLGHSHIDMAWLWPVSETWEVAQRTFESVLKLQQQFPDLTFCHSTPALYAWIEQHRPDLFAAIQQQVAAGRWEIVGGMWVEPDLNLINGESIVRQILYGQRYVQEKFGQLTSVAWLPDTFGFCWQLPQILRLGGIKYFVTQKLRWNDTTKFPYGTFWWQAPDGSQIFSLMSNPIGEGIDPIKMAAYVCEWEQTDLQDALWLFGVGDHGGGPTRDMLEVANRWQQSPFFPRLEFSTAHAYLQHISSVGAVSVGAGLANNLGNPQITDKQNPPSPIGNPQIADKQNPPSSIQDTQITEAQNPPSSVERNQNTNARCPMPDARCPIWNNELYLEFHRGCYTTHADQKRWNRRSEALLYQAELFASLATISTGATYPKTELEDAWKKVLFNQFHDILPGTAIPQVFVEANQAWQEVERVGSEVLDSALRAIASQITLPPPPQPDALPVIVFNPLNWQRSDVVAVPLPAFPPFLRGDRGDRQWQIYDLEGKQLACQLVSTATNAVTDFTDKLSANPSATSTPLFKGGKGGSESPATRLLFLATDIPAVGYRVFWLCRPQPGSIDNTLFQDELTLNFTVYAQPNTSISQNLDSEQKKFFAGKNWTLENQFLRVFVDSETGNLSSVYDKIHNWEILNQEGGNQLQAFEDSGQYWDAWNIDPNYSQHPLTPTQLKFIEWVEQGPVQQRLRVVRQLGQSVFCQDYVLQAESPVLKIATTVDWQESHVLVKAAFSFNLEADYATYEMSCGAIERPTKPNTPTEQAKWEVPALRWADLTGMGHGAWGEAVVLHHSRGMGHGGKETRGQGDKGTRRQGDKETRGQGDKGTSPPIPNPQSPITNPQSPTYGVSLLNDCKYGYDSQPNQLRLTLLRSPKWPDPEADKGIHQFTYALYPHVGSWRSAHTVRRGYELNLPLQVMVCSPVKGQGDTHLPPAASLLDLSAENLILMAFKQSEDDPHKWILRCYECHGEEAQLKLQSDLGLEIAHPVDLLEQPVDTPELSPDSQTCKIAPWKIVSCSCRVRQAGIFQ